LLTRSRSRLAAVALLAARSAVRSHGIHSGAPPRLAYEHERHRYRRRGIDLWYQSGDDWAGGETYAPGWGLAVVL